METVFLTLLNRSAAAGWLILAVAALRLLLKKAPKSMRCALWGLVGLRLALPFSIQSVWSLIPRAGTVSARVLPTQTAAAPSTAVTTGTAAQAAVPAAAPVVKTAVSPIQLASWVWLAGMVVLLLYCAVSYLRLRHRVSRAVRLRDNLWQSEAVASPFILGLFRPKIYLPFHLDEGAMAHAVAHEQAHLRRRDHWIKPLAFLLLAVYWFHPLVWAAYILLCRDIELACDERVVRDYAPAQKKEYAAALLSCSVSRRTLAACPLAFGEVGVKQRIKNVLHYKKPGFWILLAALIVCIATAVCFLTDPKEEPVEVEKPPVTYPAEMPEDFAVRYQWTGYQVEHGLFDTAEGLLERESLDGVRASTACQLSEESLRAIYEKIVAVDAASMDQVYLAAEGFATTTGLGFPGIWPCPSYDLEFTMNGQTYSVSGEAGIWYYREADQQADRYCELMDLVQALVEALPEYQALSSAPRALPDDFAVCFQWWTDASRPNVFDTDRGLLQKDLVLDGTAADEVYEATEETLRAIYEQLVALDAASISRTMTSGVLSTDGMLIDVEPCIHYALRFTMDGQTYEIQGDSSAWFYRDTDQEAERFCQLAAFLSELVTALPEYQALPEAEGGYD